MIRLLFRAFLLFVLYQTTARANGESNEEEDEDVDA